MKTDGEKIFELEKEINRLTRDKPTGWQHACEAVSREIQDIIGKEGR